MAVKFQEGWQKKAGHENIRNRGDAARKAAQLAEKAAKATHQPQKPQASHAAKKPVAPGKDVAQTHQRIRPETQDQASRMAHASEAAKKHVEVRDDARNLQTLQTKATTPKGTETATRTAVTTKPDPQQANVKTQDANAAQQPEVANQAAQAQTQVAKKPVESKPELPKAKQPQKGKGKAKDGKKTAANAKTQAQDAEGAARTVIIANQAGIAGAQGIAGELEAGRTGLDDVDIDEEDGAEEEKDHNVSSFAKGSSKARRKKNGLDQLLSGSSGESDAGEAEAEALAQADVSAAMNTEELPEADPTIQVFNEYDTTVKDPKYIAEKGGLYIKLVEKRIKEIAKLDREIEGEIKNIFETTPLSKRVVGDLKEDLRTADFVTSVYGGISG